MLILIAESKTMTSCDNVVDMSSCNTPLLDDKATELMYSLRGMTAEQLAAAVKISLPMALRLRDMIYEFGDKRHGSSAMDAFTGVVFRAFRYSTLTGQDKQLADKKIRIISSLYGWLRPSDIVKAYRFDFTTKLAPGNETFASYWRDDVTGLLLKEIDSTGNDEILNLLPGEAEREIDWTQIRKVAKVAKAAFVEVTSATSRRTPTANRLKTLRGELLRQIITQQIDSFDALCFLENDNYIADSTLGPDGTIVFTTA